MHFWNMNTCNKTIYFPQGKKKSFSGDTIPVLVHSVRSLPRYVDDILTDNRIIINNITGNTNQTIRFYL